MRSAEASASFMIMFFFHPLQKECKSLIDYLVERFRPILEAIDYVPTGTKLVLRYEQLHDKSGAGSVDDKLGSDDTTNTARRGWSGMDKDEEAYFKDDGDDEEPEIGPHPEKATPTTEAVDSESETNIDDDDDLAHLPSIRRSSADDDDDEDGMFTRRLPSKGRVDSAPPTGGGLLKGRPRAGGLIAGGSVPSATRKIVFAPTISLRVDNVVDRSKKSYGLVDYEDDEEESAVTSVSGTSSKKSSPPSVSDLPPAAAVTPTKRSASTLSPSTDPRTLSPDIPVEEATPTKVRSLTLGAKRMAIAPGDVGGSEATHESATTATTTSEAIKGDSTD